MPAACQPAGTGAGCDTSKRKECSFKLCVCEVDFMVKLLRACVWMPRRKKAKKDAISCEKLRGAANRL